MLLDHKANKCWVRALSSSWLIHSKTCFLPPFWSLPLCQPTLSLCRPFRIWTVWSALCDRQKWVTTRCFAVASSYRAVGTGMCYCRMPGQSTVTCLKPAASSPFWRSSSRNNPRPRHDFFLFNTPVQVVEPVTKQITYYHCISCVKHQFAR